MNELTHTQRRVRLPAVFLIVTAAFNLLTLIIFIVYGLGMGVLINIAPIDEQLPMDDSGPVSRLILIATYSVISVIGLIFALLTLRGGINMLGLKHYRSARLGSIVAILPSFCCLLGVPAGIWALVVLNDDAVRTAFPGQE
ncbi:MAG: hypothetical protein KDK30_15550 [Leptospiraceae bacterium]|nr:hypothetical protein [Leptospiraceae bacterium]MCB1317184.1 hypothetical protein [Leptospiraceae bacterium]